MDLVLEVLPGSVLVLFLVNLQSVLINTKQVVPERGRYLSRRRFHYSVKLLIGELVELTGTDSFCTLDEDCIELGV